MTPPRLQDAPAEVIEDGDDYDDDGFEDYSDHSEGQDGEREGRVPLTAPSSSRGGPGMVTAIANRSNPNSPLMSAAIKKRQADYVLTPDDKVNRNRSLCYLVVFLINKGDGEFQARNN